MLNSILEKRIKGVLIGVAIGDAMGMPTEFLTFNKIKETVGKITDFLPSLKNDFIERDMKAGEITDDTINTLLILDTIVDSNGIIETHKYINKLLNWVRNSEKSELVVGPTTLKALESIEKGVPVSSTGKFGTTNGAAMKIAPIGIISDFNDLENLVNNVHQICMPTHNTSIAIAGASVVAACVSYATSGGNSWDDVWDIASKAAKLGLQKGMDMPTPSLITRLKYAKSIVDNTPGEEVLQKIYDNIGTGLSSIETIPAALAIAYFVNGDPMECARICASIGGDTDTLGAIGCAICGGMNQNFDESAINLIENVNGINFDDLAKKIVKYSPFYIS